MRLGHKIHVLVTLSTHRCCCLQFGLFLFSPVLRTCEILYAPHRGLRHQQLRANTYAPVGTEKSTKCAEVQKQKQNFLKIFISLSHEHLQILTSLKSRVFSIKCAGSSVYRERVFLNRP
jgi:hypothetical protein